MKKRFISFFTALSMILVMLAGVPIGVSAAAHGDYELDRNGNLTIYSDDGMTEWIYNGLSDASEVKTICLDSYVTSIPESSFGYCPNLTSVEIGSGVQTIDADAFSLYNMLTEITVAPGNTTYSSEGGVLFNIDKTQLICCPAGTQGTYEIPSSVQSIEPFAFHVCKELTSITTAEGSRLTSIGEQAFNECSNLQNIDIPASLTSMSIDESNGNPFINCGALTAINVAAGNTAYSSANGVLFNKD